MHDLDEYLQAQLLLSALGITAQLLRPRGTFVAKIFRGKDITLLYAQLKLFFPSVVCAKPKSSRNTSVEAFVVCRGFAPPDKLSVSDIAGLSTWQYPSVELGLSLGRTVVPFVACGDLGGYDADANYPLPDQVGGVAYVSREPVQKPTTPAYRAFLEACATGRALVLDREVGGRTAGGSREGGGVQQAGRGSVGHLDGAWAALDLTGGSRPGECNVFDALTE
jgi:tRNA (cytidine32/guanosine34-2'-O)-methyltransferase